jgi:CRISPR-associated endonuclease Csn1
MPKISENRPYILGIDLGVQSLGWAILDLDERNQPCGIRRTGVRCFDSGVGSEKEIEMGKDESANAKRRTARQQRRQLWRRAQRQRRVLHILQQGGLLPQTSVLPQSRHEMFKKLDLELFAKHVTPGDRIEGHLLPYRLRVKALDEALEPHALGRAIYHLAQRRGFLSNKKAKKDDKEEGVVKEGIAELQQEITNTGSRTLGEYFCKLDPEEKRIRSRWTHRNMFLDEFEKIIESQNRFHAFLSEDYIKQLRKAMFFQRPLKSQRGLIGKCELEKGQRRAPMASLSAQRYRYWQKINDLEIISPRNEVYILSPENKRKLADEFELHEELSFAAIRKVLGIKKLKGETEDYRINLEAGGEKKLKGNRTAAKIYKILGERWQKMPEKEQEGLIREIISFEKEDALAKRLATAWGFDEKTAAHLAALDFEPGYCALSLRAIEKILPRLQNGISFATARKELYGEMLNGEEVQELLPPVLKASGQLRNPVVCRTLTEMRKVVNAIIRLHGKPSRIRIEMARDMKKGRKAREKSWKTSRENEKIRDEAKKKILLETGIQEPRPGDILKVRLAEECNWECPYTGRSITPATLLGDSPQFDIEHIIPFSRSLDNSFGNRTLCYHEENRNVKKNQTPFEAYGPNSDKWHEILMRLRRFRGPAADSKLRKFLLTEIPEDFATRQLNDTRYMSKLAADYVGLLYGGQIDAEGTRRVQSSSGGITAYLRDEWSMNEILGDGGVKNREDHRHHAVDAVAIALSSPSTVELLSFSAAKAQDLGRRLFVPIERPRFLDDLRNSIEEINVSYRVDRRIGGALHDQTNYSPPKKRVGENSKANEVSHVRKLLQNMSADEIEEIVDDRIKKVVKAQLERLGGDPRKAFAEKSDHPYLKTKDGRIIPIHKARIRKNIGTMAIGKSEKQRYVAPGSNHHIEIIAELDAQGRDNCWYGEVVNLYEAAQRAKRHEPVIRHDHGPGKEFRFSLAGGEYVEMEHEKGKKCLYRVTGISQNVLEFRLHTDARAITVVRKIPKARVTRSPGKLRDAKARKVAIDPLGNVVPAHD